MGMGFDPEDVGRLRPLVANWEEVRVTEDSTIAGESLAENVYELRVHIFDRHLASNQTIQGERPATDIRIIRSNRAECIDVLEAMLKARKERVEALESK